MDIDWGDIPDEKEEHAKLLADCEAAATEAANYDMVVNKSWAEYAKEINLMRAQLRYMKKSIMYRSGGWGCNVEENRRDIAEQEKAIKRLCKLRDAAKAMEKAAGYKMGEMK